MNEFLLMVMFCTDVTSDPACSWRQINTFKTEQQCVMHGLSTQNAGRIKCVEVVRKEPEVPKEAAPKVAEVPKEAAPKVVTPPKKVTVPLPRSRPSGTWY